MSEKAEVKAELPPEKSFVEKAKRRLEKGTVEERKDLAIAKDDLTRIRATTKENEERLFALKGPPEEEYSGFGPKKPYVPTGLIADARDALDEAMTQGNRVGQKQKALDRLLQEAERLDEWLSERSGKAIVNAEAKVKQCEAAYRHKAQSIYSQTTAEGCKVFDEGVAKAYGAYVDDIEIRMHFAMTVPGWQMPEAHPINAAGFVSTLYPNAAALDHYSKMIKTFPFDRDRAKHIHLANTHKRRAEAQARLDRIYDGNLNRSISMKVKIFEDNNKAAGCKVSDEVLAGVTADARAEYVSSHPRPIATEKDIIIDDDKQPEPVKERTFADVREVVLKERREMYLARGLTEKGEERQTGK